MVARKRDEHKDVYNKHVKSLGLHRYCCTCIMHIFFLANMFICLNYFVDSYTCVCLCLEHILELEKYVGQIKRLAISHRQLPA